MVKPSKAIADVEVPGVLKKMKDKAFARAVKREDITAGAESTGGMWEQGDFGVVEVREDGTGSALIDKKVEIWEMIGRSMVISRERPEVGRTVRNDKDTLVGVVARSAGVWENTKVVC